MKGDSRMFARIKKSVRYVISTVGRMDRLRAKGEIENLVRSLSRFSEKTLLILSGKSEVNSSAKKIDHPLIFERLWKEPGIKDVIKNLLAVRRLEFDVELAIFLTVLHRLLVSGMIGRLKSKSRRIIVLIRNSY